MLVYVVLMIKEEPTVVEGEHVSREEHIVKVKIDGKLVTIRNGLVSGNKVVAEHIASAMRCPSFFF